MKRLRLETLQAEVTAARRRADLIHRYGARALIRATTRRASTTGQLWA
jgi:hypothetical protein